MMHRNSHLCLLAALLTATASGEVVISEILSHTDPPLEDAIELQNLGTTEVDISYWWLSDARSEPRKFLIPPGTVLPAGGFIVFYQAQFETGPNGFSLNSAHGDQVYLSAGDAQGNLAGPQTSVTFDALANGISAGRVQTSRGVDFVPLAYPTFGIQAPASLSQFRQGRGLSNSPPRVGPVVLSEVMFRPDILKDSEASQYEYVELHNPSSQVVPLHDSIYLTNTWRMGDGLNFTFPPHFSLPARGFALLVSFDPALETDLLARFRTKFSAPAEVPILGPYEGRLGDRGDTLELRMPDVPQGPDKPDAGFVPYVLIERIEYALDGGWPSNTSGTGLSLQRTSLGAYGNEPVHWVAAPPSAGRALTTDSDNDGLPDQWEIIHGLNPLSAADQAADPDQDHYTNYEEFIAGTDPRNPLSLLKIESLLITREGIQLTFIAQLGRIYQCQQLQDAWRTVAQLTNGAAGRTEWQLPVSVESSGFFRLLTQWSDPGALHGRESSHREPSGASPGHDNFLFPSSPFPFYECPFNLPQ